MVHVCERFRWMVGHTYIMLACALRVDHLLGKWFVCSSDIVHAKIYRRVSLGVPSRHLCDILCASYEHIVLLGFRPITTRVLRMLEPSFCAFFRIGVGCANTNNTLAVCLYKTLTKNHQKGSVMDLPQCRH